MTDFLRLCGSFVLCAFFSLNASSQSPKGSQFEKIGKTEPNKRARGEVYEDQRSIDGWEKLYSHATVSRFFSRASELFPKDYPRRDGVEINQFHAEFRYPKKMLEELKMRVPAEMLSKYSENIPMHSFACLRNSMIDLLRAHIERAAQIPGKYLIEPHGCPVNCLMVFC
jgi:hypothetical protein